MRNDFLRVLFFVENTIIIKSPPDNFCSKSKVRENHDQRLND